MDGTEDGRVCDVLFLNGRRGCVVKVALKGGDTARTAARRKQMPAAKAARIHSIAMIHERIVRSWHMDGAYRTTNYRLSRYLSLVHTRDQNLALHFFTGTSVPTSADAARGVRSAAGRSGRESHKTVRLRNPSKVGASEQAVEPAPVAQLRLKWRTQSSTRANAWLRHRRSLRLLLHRMKECAR